MTQNSSPQLSPRLLEVLRCPITRTLLVYDKNAGELLSQAAGLAYPVRDGVPIMVAEAARPLDVG